MKVLSFTVSKFFCETPVPSRYLLKLSILSILFWAISPAALLAGPADGAGIEDTPLKPPPNGSPSDPSVFWEFARILIALAVVIAAIYLLLRLARRFLPGLAGSGRVAQPVKSLARFPIAPKQTLHLVRCGSRLFLLGATSASINHLATIADTQEIDRILQALDRGGSVLSGLGNFMNRSAASAEDSNHESDSLTEQVQEQP